MVAVAVPPGSTTTRQHVDRSLRKAPHETMPTLVALQRPPALPPIGPPPPYPRRTNRTPSLNLPAILAIHPQAPFGNTLSPVVDGDGSSVVGVAVGGGTDILSGGDDSCDQVNPHEVNDDSDGFSEEVNDDNDYSGFSEDDDKKARDPNWCLDYSTDEDDEDNYIFDPDLEEFELVDFADPSKGSKKIRGRRGNISGPQPPDYSTMNPVEKKVAEADFIRERRQRCSQQWRSRMTNLSAGVTDFTGVLTGTLRTMQQVQEGIPSWLACHSRQGI